LVGDEDSSLLGYDVTQSAMHASLVTAACLYVSLESSELVEIS